jgi:hypothetical protein
VDHALEPGRLRLETSPVVVQQLALSSRVVAAEQLADRLERNLQVTEPNDGTRGLDLVAPVQPVAARRVDLGGPKQVQLVVMAQRTRR